MNSAHGSAPKPPVAVFLAASIVMFGLSLSAADSVGFVPCQIDSTCTGTQNNVALSDLPQLGITGTSTAQGVLPVHIKIASVGIDLPVQNPDTTNVDALDALLNKGPARFVNSAQLGQKGNMLIFAHSSHLPIAHPMFKAFNDIPNVQKGDTVEVDGADGNQYLYSVDSVARAEVGDGTVIDLSPAQGTKLTLVTCDTLTGKSARFILTAHFIGEVNSFSK